METAKIMNTIELQKMVDKLCTEKDAAVHSAANFIKENIKQRQEILKLTARIADLEALIEKLVDEGCVIAERFSVKGGSEVDLEDWENVIDEYKAVMPEVQE